MTAHRRRWSCECEGFGTRRLEDRWAPRLEEANEPSELERCNRDRQRTVLPVVWVSSCCLRVILLSSREDLVYSIRVTQPSRLKASLNAKQKESLASTEYSLMTLLRSEIEME